MRVSKGMGTCSMAEIQGRAPPLFSTMQTLISFKDMHTNISFLEFIDCSRRCENKGGYSKVYQ